MTVAEQLRDVGYRCGAIVAAPPLDHWFGLDRGFEHYDDEVPPIGAGGGKAIKPANAVVDRALAWLQEGPQEQPVFLFVHFFDAHWPYDPPARWRGRHAHLYEDEVGRVDHELGRLLRELERGGRDPANRCLVVFGDHGEDLAGHYANDHAGPDHPEERGHGCLLFDGTQHVPLWVRWPGVPASAVRAQVSLVDIAPTLLAAGGAPAPPGDGRDLSAWLDDPGSAGAPVYCETYFREELRDIGGAASLSPLVAVRIPDRFKIIRETATATLAVYDLQADPEERGPLSASVLSDADRRAASVVGRWSW